MVEALLGVYDASPLLASCRTPPYDLPNACVSVPGHWIVKVTKLPGWLIVSLYLSLY